MNNQLLSEINIIINNLKEYFSFSQLKDEFSLDSKVKNKEELIKILSYLKEIEKFSQKSSFEFSIVSNLKKVFDNIKKNIKIEIIDIVNIKELLILSNKFKDTFIDNKLNNIFSDASSLYSLNLLINKINKIIKDDLSISSDASTSLKTIRKEITLAKKIVESSIIECKEKYKSYLSEEIISSRDGFDVLLIKSKSIRNVPGYLVSYSSSKESAYIVPIEVLQNQNNLTRLLEQEQNEINKIILSLISEINIDIDKIIFNYNILMKWNKYFSIYNYGLSYKGSIGNLSENISLNNLFHPLIGYEMSVKNSYELNKDGKSILFISGPNAGGKSVLLRASCICLLMFSLGLLIPCSENSFLPLVDNIILISGDSQSLENNLSTFSSHLKELKTIFSLPNNSSFVAIDEICNGTSPSDGVSLAKSIIDYLIDKKIYSLITSHFDNLIQYAFNKKEILSCSMEFSLSNLEPTFHLITSSMGLSYGIELANMVGFSKEIINKANLYKKELKEYDIEKVNKKLKEELKKEKELVLSLEEKKKNIEELEKKKKEILNNIEVEKKAIYDTASKKIQKEVDKRISKLDDIFNSSLSTLPLNKQIELKTALKNVAKEKDEIKKEKVIIPKLEVNQTVLDENNKYYKVLNIKKDKVTLISDGVKITRSIIGLKKSEYKEKKKISVSTYYRNENNFLPSSLNIIGKTKEEAIREFSTFISSAAIKKYSSVKIIHGMGTYTLKNALWDYLSKSELVKSYRLGVSGEGGIGVTIVELK